MGSFSVVLSAFLLGPVFGMLVNRIVRADKDAGGDPGGKEDLVVR